MSLPLPVPRPGRSNTPAPQPFRVVLPDLDHALDEPVEPGVDGRTVPDAKRLVLADLPEVDEAPPLAVVTHDLADDENPRGLVILEQVLGRRDVEGRPVTFARKLRHRLFGFALGLTIVSAASLVIGLVGDIDSALQSPRDEIENLGTSAISFEDDETPRALLGVAEEESGDSGRTADESAAGRVDDDTEAADGVPRLPAWLEGVIEDEETEPSAEGLQP